MYCIRIAAMAVLTALASHAADLQFEVASLKASQRGQTGGGIRPAPGGRRYVATNVPLRLLITVAYRVNNDQVSGGPGWIDTDHFDMNAEAEQPSSIEELHGMLRNLLRERFELQMHSETKERPVYALSVDKSGIKMTPHAIGSAGDPRIEQPVPGKLTAQFTAMDYFAWLLSMFMDRPILDRTGLKGGYDFSLSWTPVLSAGLPDSGVFNAGPADASGPGIFEALRTQLGLKLEPQRGQVEILVIDRVAKPVSN